ncbi:MAG TPA: SDR family oxidoreductase [Spirochaetia bacterium]|nr:SDR family oxidoreductase [Spirochaetia bacterium]
MGYIEEMFGLENVRAVVTGGAGVIPGAMAEALVRAGARVAIWGRGVGHPVGDAVKALTDRTGATDSVVGVTVDTGSETSVEAAYAETEEKLGAPNLLVNGVGGNRGKGPFVDLDIKSFMEILDLNVLAGLVIPTKVFARHWIEQKISASIINLASMSSYVPLSGVWAYDAAKAAVLNLTMATAKEFAPHGIRVNGIAPGFFLGHQNKALLVKDEASGALTDRGTAVIAHTPFARFGEYGDIKGATLFLASPAASGFITGVTIPVDGGYLINNI